MSAYIYSLRGPKNIGTIILANGARVTASKLAYAYKPSWSGRSAWERLAEARIERTAKLWREHGPTPQYTVSVNDNGKFEEGCVVYDWHHRRVLLGDGAQQEFDGSRSTSCADEPNMGGCRIVGQLARRGKDWHVVAYRPHVPSAATAAA